MTYYGANRKTYILDDIPIKKGGEGAIHTVSGKSNLLAKIYLAPAKSPELKEKISLMVKNPPRQDILDQIAWPIDILSDAGGNFVGFVMPKLSIDVELGDVYKYDSKKKVVLSGEQKVVVAVNICRVISAIHELDFVFGDFNPCNIGVNLKNGHVAFLDTDSYHITDKARGKTYRCNVCLTGYVAPELIKKCKNTGYAQAPLPTFTKETDLFALAIHIFKLLMNGFTPYNGIPENEHSSTASPGVGNAAIEMDHYCFKAGNRPLSVAVLPLQAFPNDVQNLFTRAFDEGHRNPSKRPTAKEWDAVLTSYHSNLKQCNANPMHHHYKGLQTCPYCEADQRYNFTMSMSSVYGTSSGSPSSGQMSFSTPMTPPPTPPSSSSSYTSSSYNSSGSGQYSGTVLSGSGSSTRVSQRNSNGFSRKLPKAIIISVLAIILVVGGYFGITTAINNNKIEKVEALIADLPTDENYYLDYQAEIVDAYAAYMELDPKLQDKVENADKLKSVMDGLKVAEAYEQRQNMQFTKLDGGGYSVKLKEGANAKISGELIVPGVYRQEPVVAIEDYAFENCRSITSVVVPDSITTIGLGAFKGCSNLETLELPFTGKSKDSTAFEAVLGYIFGYSTQTSNLKSHDQNNVYVNSQTGTVDGAVWQYSCYNYSSYYSNRLQSYFYYIPSSIKSVTITNQTDIKSGAFNGCKNIKRIKYIQELSSIGTAAFQNCVSLQNFNSDTVGEINLMGNYSVLEAYAFKNCTTINNVVFSNNMVTIGEYSLENLSITSLVIPNGVESIYIGALHKCNEIEKITMPFVGKNESAEAYEAVLGYIFGYTTQTSNLQSHDQNNVYVNSQTGSIDGAIWQYSCYNYSSYYSNRLQSYFYYIPSSLTEVIITEQTQVPTAAFNGCKSIELIQFNGALQKIGDAAMQNCEKLTSFNSEKSKTIDLSGNIEIIGNYAFRNCKIVENIIFGFNKSIGNHSFDGCINVLSFDLNNNINYIGNYAFKDISIPTELVVYNSTESIGVGAFEGCNGLENITLPFTGKSNSATAYEAVFGYVFGFTTQTSSQKSHDQDTVFVNSQTGNVDGSTWQYSCYNYSSYYSNRLQSYFYHIPSSVKMVTISNQENIQIGAFNGCKNIVSIKYDKTIKDIGSAAFQNCLSLQNFNSNKNGELNLSGSFHTLGSYSFKNCSLIDTVILPNGLISIGEYSMENLSITSLKIPDSVETIYLGALYNCNKLKKIELPFIGKNESANAYEAVLGYVFGYETRTSSQKTHDQNTTFVNTQTGSSDVAVWQYSCYNYSSYYSNRLQSYFYFIPSSLTEVIITEQKKIPIAAFNGCTMLQTIEFRKGASSRGEAAFQNCPATIIEGN